MAPFPQKYLALLLLVQICLRARCSHSYAGLGGRRMVSYQIPSKANSILGLQSATLDFQQSSLNNVIATLREHVVRGQKPRDRAQPSTVEGVRIARDQEFGRPFDEDTGINAEFGRLDVDCAHRCRENAGAPSQGAASVVGDVRQPASEHGSMEDGSAEIVDESLIVSQSFREGKRSLLQAVANEASATSVGANDSSAGGSVTRVTCSWTTDRDAWSLTLGPAALPPIGVDGWTCCLPSENGDPNARQGVLVEDYAAGVLHFDILAVQLPGGSMQAAVDNGHLVHCPKTDAAAPAPETSSAAKAEPELEQLGGADGMPVEMVEAWRCTRSRHATLRNDYLTEAVVVLDGSAWCNASLAASLIDVDAGAAAESLFAAEATEPPDELVQGESRSASGQAWRVEEDDDVRHFSSHYAGPDIILNEGIIAAGELIADVPPYPQSMRTMVVAEHRDQIANFRLMRQLGMANGMMTDPFPLGFSPAWLLPGSLSVQQDGSLQQPAAASHDTAPWLIEAALEPALDKLPSWQRCLDMELDTELDAEVAAGLGVNWDLPDDVERPESDEDIAYLTMMEMAALLRSRQITSTELVQICIDRMRRLDPYLEVLVTMTEDLAQRQAAQADRELQGGCWRGPLHGIPYSLKDIIAVQGYPTTWGAQPFQEQTFEESAWVYKRLSQAGAVLIAKLASGSMAWGDIWFGGRTKNPWNLLQGSSGSSSGSAASVSAGLVPFSIGTETWGSVSTPARRTGVVGMRPTFGSVGRTGIMSLSATTDTVGVLCRHATDCGMVLDALRGRDADDPSSVAVPQLPPQRVRLPDVRLGLLPGVHPKMKLLLELLGIQTASASLDMPVLPSRVISVVLDSEAGASFDSMLRNGQIDDARDQRRWPALIRAAKMIPASEYIQANRARMRLAKAFADGTEGLDGLVVPIDGESDDLYSGMWNLLGIPEVTVPWAAMPLPEAPGSPRKRPIALTVVGKPGTDAVLMAVASALSSFTNMHRERPPVHQVEPEVLRECLPFSRCSFADEQG